MSCVAPCSAVTMPTLVLLPLVISLMNVTMIVPVQMLSATPAMALSMRFRETLRFISRSDATHDPIVYGAGGSCVLCIAVPPVRLPPAC